MKIIEGIGSDGKPEYIVRKTKWLLILMFLKIIFLTLLIILLLYFNFKIKQFFVSNGNFNYIYIVDFIGILLWIFFIYIFISIVNGLIKFFYGLVIITETKIYKFNIGIFSTDDISVINMFNIQEVKSVKEGFFRVIFKISDIYLIEQRDKMTILHYIDNGVEVANLISKFKEKLIILPENK